MFKFHKLALQNAKPQNAKILLFTLVSFVILFALTYLTFIPMQTSIYSFVMAMAMQQSIGMPLFLLILTILIPLIVIIFVGYPIIAGTIYTIDKAINKDQAKFKDIFAIFKKGKYLKAVKLSLFTLLTVVVFMAINLLLAKLLNLGIVSLYTALQGPISSSDHALAISLTFQIIAATIILFIQSFIIWFMAIVIINFTVAFIKTPKDGAWTAVKRGFKGVKNGQKTWFKFFIGILLLNLIVIILANPVSQLISIGTGGISQNVATVIVYIVTIIVILIRLFIYYINILATIQYYNRGGEKITADAKNEGNSNNSIANTTEKVKSSVSNKTDSVQEKTKSEGSKLRDSINNSEK
ncbi:hypothetical protein BUZ14_12035 [Staphylococcus gallinarum]|uniref:Lytic regulatory protein n=1 Tax=Staphylococcus gallinarum TaxID=1293 RepID=A0A3A0VGN3_STAGA|nr:hypothetical protein [Staphylococcus gallinarum]RIP32867.1 hypothetical protein BUZ14_12035 [Staphylococcus gallinarum]